MGIAEIIYKYVAVWPLFLFGHANPRLKRNNSRPASDQKAEDIHPVKTRLISCPLKKLLSGITYCRGTEEPYIDRNGLAGLGDVIILT